MVCGVLDSAISGSGKFVLVNHIGGLVQDCGISSALAMELLQSCTKPSIYDLSQVRRKQIKETKFSMNTWSRHQMEAFSELLAICVGNSLVTGEFPAQKACDAELWCFHWSAPE